MVKIRSIIILCTVIVQGTDVVAGTGASTYLEKGEKVPLSEKILTIAVIAALGGGMYLAGKRACQKPHVVKSNTVDSVVATSTIIEAPQAVDIKHEDPHVDSQTNSKNHTNISTAIITYSGLHRNVTTHQPQNGVCDISKGNWEPQDAERYEKINGKWILRKIN